MRRFLRISCVTLLMFAPASIFCDQSSGFISDVFEFQARGPLRDIAKFTWLLVAEERDAPHYSLANPDDLFELVSEFDQLAVGSDFTGTAVIRTHVGLKATTDGDGLGTVYDSPLRLKRDGLQHVANTKSELDRLALSTSLTLREHNDPLDPAFKGSWETGETLRMPVAGPLFAFAQIDASSSAVEQQQYKWLGKYGVGLKLKPWIAPEVQVRGGPAMRYDDTGKPLRGTSAERSELFMEAVTKLGLPLLGPLNVEYTSYAIPAATQADRGQINQDLRLARPLLRGGELHVGARYRWEDAATSTTPWVDRMQVYMGIQLKR